MTGIDKHRGGNRKTGGALNITVTCTSTDFRVEFLYIFIFINLLGPLQMEVKARVSPMREGRHRIESHLRGYGHVLPHILLCSAGLPDGGTTSGPWCRLCAEKRNETKRFSEDKKNVQFWCTIAITNGTVTVSALFPPHANNKKSQNSNVYIHFLSSPIKKKQQKKQTQEPIQIQHLVKCYQFQNMYNCVTT